jgi:hypothetical protein
MPDTIREQIIAAYTTRLGSWLTTGGFNVSCGATVQRGLPDISESDLPACVILPQIEEVTQNYGLNICKMNIRVEAVAEISTTNPSIVQEQLLGDAITAMTDPNPYIQLTFAAGGYTDAVAGDIGTTVTGGTTGDTGRLISYDNTTRKWIIDPTDSGDTFDNASEAITCTGTGAGTLSAVGSSAPVTTLIEDIIYTAGGPASGFKGEDTTVAVFAEFKIEYNTLSGNPYSQG